MKKLNNTVIKNLSPQMGKRIIEKYQSDGWDTGESTGNNYYGMDTDWYWEGFYYYGVIDGQFSDFNSKWIESDQNNYVSIIELDEWRLNGVSDIGVCRSKGLSDEDRIAVRSVVLAQALVNDHRWGGLLVSGKAIALVRYRQIFESVDEWDIQKKVK